MDEVQQHQLFSWFCSQQLPIFFLWALTYSWCPDTFLQLWSCFFEFSRSQVFWEQWACLDKASPAVCCDTALQQKLLPSSTVFVKISLKWTVLDSLSDSRQAAHFILLELELAIQGSSHSQSLSVSQSHSLTGCGNRLFLFLVTLSFFENFTKLASDGSHCNTAPEKC